MEGFGEKSFQNLMESLEKAKKTELPRVIYALGIPNIGLANAKMICKEFAYDMEKIRHLTEEELARVDGIGPVIAKSFVDYFAKEGRQEKIDRLIVSSGTAGASQNRGRAGYAGVNLCDYRKRGAFCQSERGKSRD